MKTSLIFQVLAVLLSAVSAEREGCTFQITTQSRTIGQDENGIVLENNNTLVSTNFTTTAGINVPGYLKDDQDRICAFDGRFFCDESVTVNIAQKFQLRCDGTISWVRQDLGTGSYFGTCPSGGPEGVRNIMMNAGKRSQCAANARSEKTRLVVSKLCLVNTSCPLNGPTPLDENYSEL